MPGSSGFTSSTDTRGVATVTLDRPKIHNAFDDALIASLTAELARLAGDAGVRIVVLAANGKSFSAGADLGWMKRMAAYSEAENLKDAASLATLMRALDRLPKPTIAAVHGNAFAGGTGLVACCDIAIAADGVQFALTEVKLGLIPSVISPYVIRAIGERAARRLFLTAERFDAREALRLGLVHDVVPPEQLANAVEHVVFMLLEASPAALAASKELIRRVADSPIDEALIAETASRIARVRVSPEGQEGIAAFLEKRKPRWRV
jgi:methylglutaconyl-CoA hydratase